ncbi:MAG: hypothetical protein K2G77_05695 [Muribaculaceae bacterium]|nr:hypothetical protein [Muribaculaceae bacterium]
MKIQAYIYHKRAEQYRDCQDYFKIDLENNRIAVADGMTQSIYPQWWAKILVNAYLENGKIPASTEELKIYQDIWQKQVQEEIAKRENDGKNPWRLKNAFAERSGAGSTICGFSWNDGTWKCQCIGDSSIIEVSKDYSIRILSSQEGIFGNHPDYLDSFRNGQGSVKEFQGSFNDAKTILLVTDPFSELFQKHMNNKKFITDRLMEIDVLTDHHSFCETIERWRDDFEMHNDDSTLIMLNDFSTLLCEHEHIDSLEDLCLKETEGKPVDERLQLIEKTFESHHSDNTFVTKESRIKAALEERDIAEAKAKDLECELNSAKEKAKALQKDKDRAEAKAKDLEQELNLAKEKAKALQKDKDRAEAKAKDLEQELNLAKEKAKALQKDKDRAEAKAKNLEQELDLH